MVATCQLATKWKINRVWRTLSSCIRYHVFEFESLSSNIWNMSWNIKLCRSANYSKHGKHWWLLRKQFTHHKKQVVLKAYTCICRQSSRNVTYDHKFCRLVCVSCVYKHVANISAACHISSQYDVFVCSACTIFVWREHVTCAHHMPTYDCAFFCLRTPSFPMNTVRMVRVARL